MEVINLPTFLLEKYDKDNEKHKIAASLLESDKDYDNYMEPFWSLENSVNYSSKQGKYTAVYLAYLNSELIGVIGIIWIMGLPELVISILPEKRGNHYSMKLIKEYIRYVFDTYKEYNEIFAHIHSENIHSIENVLAAGFQPINEFMYSKKRY